MKGMTEKEAVIRVKTENFGNNYGFDMQLLIDAVGTLGEMFRNGQISETATILKEQEPIEPRNTYLTTPSGKVIPHIFCGKCNKEIYAIYAFCPFCGQAVKWNA